MKTNDWRNNDFIRACSCWIRVSVFFNAENYEEILMHCFGNIYNFYLLCSLRRAELVETHPTLKVQAVEDMKVRITYTFTTQVACC
jgi:hypothetical protein